MMFALVVMCLNTVLTVISLIIRDVRQQDSRKSQYRSHGYLFNRYVYRCCILRQMSQYRSHGYLFNLAQAQKEGKQVGLNTVLTVISLIQPSSLLPYQYSCLNTVLTVISLITGRDARLKASLCLNTVLTVISLIR